MQMMWKTHRHTGSEEDNTIYKEALNQTTAEMTFLTNNKNVFLPFSISFVSILSIKFTFILKANLCS